MAGAGAAHLPDASSAPVGRGEFDEVYRSSWSQLVRLAALLLGETASAEDVVQDAFANTYVRLDRLSGSAGIGAYVRAAVVNGARSRLRHRKVVLRRAGHLVGLDSAPSPDSALLVAEEHRAALTALQSLPRRQREVLVLRYWVELSEAEISATLGISRGAVKSSAARGIASLGHELGGTS